MMLMNSDGQAERPIPSPDAMVTPDEPALPAVIDYFQRAREIFDRAERGSATRVEKSLRLAGGTVLLRFANGTLVPLLSRALAHLETAPGGGAPNLTLRLWDGKSTGHTLPPPDWRRDAYLRHGAVQGYHSGRHSVLFQADCGLLSLVDHLGGEAIVYAMDAEEIPYYETAAPLRASLGPWLASRGFQIIHAAAVGLPEGGVLIVGEGGSGKSTTAATCIGSRLGFLADDYCVVSAGRVPTVVALYSTAKLRPEGLDLLPHLRGWIANADRLDREKPTLFIWENAPGDVVGECPLRAILVPEKTGGANTELLPCSRAAALRRLAPNTLAQQPGADAGAFRRLAALASGLPARTLALGTRMEDIPPAILKFLETTLSESGGKTGTKENMPAE